MGDIVTPPEMNFSRRTESNVSSTRNNKKSVAKRNEPEREFFEMTVLSFILTHPSSKNIMTMDRTNLFDECTKTHKSFHEWPTWINSTMTRIVLNEKYNKAQAAGSMT